MTEILYESAREGLMTLWLEAKVNGLEGLSDEAWQKLQALDKEVSEKKLGELRQELKDKEFFLGR